MGATAEEQHARPEQDLSPMWVLATLLKARRVMIGAVVVGAVVALAVSFFIPVKYTTTFSFTPAATSDEGGAGLAQLAGQFGVALGGLTGQGQPPQFYADLLSTREILSPIVRDSFAPTSDSTVKEPLAVLLHTDDKDPNRAFEGTLKELQETVVQAAVQSRTTGVVTVSVRTTSPQVSFALAQRLVASVNDFNARTAQEQASDERRFLEARLADEQTALRAAEDAQQHFLQLNRSISSSPELTFEMTRLQRNVDFHSGIVTSIAQQYEQARINEVRDTPAISLVDRPTLARLPDPRGRGKLVLGVAFFTAMVTASVVLLRDWWPAPGATDADPALLTIRDELDAFWRSLRRRRA